MARRKRTRAQLVTAAEHICYEIWMLHEVGYALTTGHLKTMQGQNAFINSFAVHTRNLIEFLYERKGEAKKDAILAEDFFENSADWVQIRPKQSRTLKAAKIRCEKQVAHLTYTRQKKEPWNFVAILGAMHEPLSLFVNGIDRSLLGEHFGPIEHIYDSNA